MVSGSIGGRVLRLGTRGSPLALVQANMVRAALQAVHGGLDVEIVPLRTTGDRAPDMPLAELGGKQLWTRELDHALSSGRVDACVHSVKDVETFRPEGFILAATLPRADVRDRLVGAASIGDLSTGARLGTSSPRRAAQLLHERPDILIVPLRGNVATRLARLADGEVDATLLASAGLERLGFHNLGSILPIDVMLPPAGQGAIGIETLADGFARPLLDAIDHRETSRCVHAERLFLAHLHAGCRSPVGVTAIQDGSALTLRAALYSADGSVRIADTITMEGDILAAKTLAAKLLDRSPPELRALFGAL